MYCICPPHAQRLMHTHSPHLFAAGSSDGSVLFSVERCSIGRSSKNYQQEESGPLAHSCDLFHLSLSLSPLHLDSNIVSGREVAVFYRTAVTTPQTSYVGGRKAVSHSLEWPFTLSVVKLSVLLVYGAPCCTLYICWDLH